jgi:hypothetical protein
MANTFDYTAYIMAPGNEDVRKAVESGQMSAQEHWDNFGQKEGRNTGQGSAVNNNNITTSTSNAAITGQTVSDGPGAGTTLTGQTTSDHPGFNSHYYLQANPDVANAIKAGQFANALDHWNQFGQYEEGRNLGSKTAYDEYVKKINDLFHGSADARAASGASPYTQEEIDAYIQSMTDPSAYYANNSLQAYGGGGTIKNPAHYVDPWSGDTSALEQAVRSGEIPFNEWYYLQQNPQVAAAIQRGEFVDAQDHYIKHGWKEGREYDKGVNQAFEDQYGQGSMTDWMDQTQADINSFNTTGYIPSTNSQLMSDGSFATGLNFGSGSGSGGGGAYAPPQIPNFWDLVYGGGGGVYGQQGGSTWGSGGFDNYSGGQGLNYGSGATSMYGSAAYRGAPMNYGSSGGGGGGTYPVAPGGGGGGQGAPGTSYVSPTDWRSGNWPGAAVPPSGGSSAGGAATPGMAQVVPGATDGQNQINVAEHAGNIASRPANFLNTDDPRTPNINEGMFMANRNHMVNPFTPGTHMNPYNAAYANLQNTIQTQNVQAAESDTKAAYGYQAFSVQDLMNQHYTQAAQGVVSNQAQVNTSIGEALFTPGVAAQLNLNDIDARATVRGQLELLQADWTDPVSGEPKIPLYAQAQAREVSKIAAFKGMTGTAATAAMSTALQEASISMAVKDAQFYQTVTLENLSNRQEMAITNANILANMELQNADNRLAAAIENSRSFLQMDLANLSNQQQANVIDSQARIQSILDYGNEVNVARRFGADAQNNMTQFYDNLNAQIRQYNAGLTQDRNQFDASMRNNREQFYAQLQYQVDRSNAEWVRNVVLNEDQQLFDANRQDVQNMIQIGQEAIAQLWDRSDSILDYAWKSTQNQLDRDATMAIEALKQGNAMELADRERDDAFWSSIGGAFFNSGGVDVIKDVGGAIFGGIFG